jgi:apolipoprotein N-acyltransferase
MFGVTFWVVLSNVLVFFIIENRHHRSRSLALVGGLILLIGVPWIQGRWALSRSKPMEGGLKLSLVQGNIDPYRKWSPSFIDSNFVRYHRLTEIAASAKPDLIVWPETATPSYIRYRPSRKRQIRLQVDSLGIPILTGAPDYRRIGEKSEVYNGAFLFRPDSWKMDCYHKIQLVPFSERVPLMGKLPILYDLARRTHLDVGGFSPGDSVVVFEWYSSRVHRTIRFSTIICYESIFPYLVRRFVRKGAQFLVIITNDGWFGNTSGPYQHAQFAVYRAIENRVWIARCANTGISEFVDPYGRVQSKTRFNQEAIQHGSVGTEGGDSLFVVWGQVFLYVILLACGCVLVFTIFKKGTNST